ncbi:gelsolin-related protein of 125 kDa-like [Ptychodera flava]|uniref:gelsolin-related protein of 125 kDa-like n=1 Tax=Ptychodera flava TaxID=63121 RepID=UPI00396A45C3
MAARVNGGDPSNKDEISKRKMELLKQYSETSTRIDLKSKLREYNFHYEGKAGELVVKEDKPLTVVEGVLRIYWGVRKPISLRKEQVPWKRRTVNIAFENGLEKKLMEKMGEASKRNRQQAKDSQIEINAEENLEEELRETEVSDDGKDITKVKQEKVTNKEAGKGIVDVKTEKDLRKEQQRLQSEKNYKRESEEIDKEKGAVKKETQEVQSKKDVVEENQVLATPSGHQKQFQSKKSTFSSKSTHVQRIVNSSSSESTRFMPSGVVFADSGNLEETVRDVPFRRSFMEGFPGSDLLNRVTEVPTWHSPDTNIPRSKSMVVKNRPSMTEQGSARRLPKSKSLRRSRKTSFSGHYYNQETAKFTPQNGTFSSVRVDSLMTSAQVIQLLIFKFAIENRPGEFMLYKVKDNGETLHLKESDFPLLERINMGPSEDYAKIFIMERAAAKDITHEVAQYLHVDHPVLLEILERLKQEEEKKVKTLKQKYESYRLLLRKRMEEISTAV